jgi:DNA modification methylase
MALLLNGDCLELMKDIDDKSVDLIFCDLPYGQTSCKWDCPIDLDIFWLEVMRVKKLNTPIFFTTTTKFGVSLINSAPKKCHFRYDIVWVKSAPAGFLSAKKMPMRKHEMIYVFYEKLPFYDLSSHSHKFLKPRPAVKKGEHIYGDSVESDKKTYDPPLPVSVVREVHTNNNGNKGGLYGKSNLVKYKEIKGGGYDPPLPVSVVKEEKQIIKGDHNTYNTEGRKKPIVREKGDKYDPPLPVSVVNEETGGATGKELDEKYKNKGGLYSKVSRNGLLKSEPHYDPPLPVSMLEIKSTRGKHSTEKPVALMEWILKYYSKEGDVILDPTMGSGSTGVACKNMNRNFIGIEKDGEIYEVAVNRVEN